MKSLYINNELICEPVDDYVEEVKNPDGLITTRCVYLRIMTLVSDQPNFSTDLLTKLAQFTEEDSIQSIVIKESTRDITLFESTRYTSMMGARLTSGPSDEVMQIVIEFIVEA